MKSVTLDYLKIDSGLAKDIAGSERDSIIVRGVIDMAKSLGLDVIAEGVESEQQLALLARSGCDFYQGFLRSGAVASEIGRAPSELQSLMRISYAVFCLKKKKTQTPDKH